MKILDLFAGIGGFSLAAHWMGWDTAAFVEWEDYPQKVLKKNFPNVPIYGDIKEFNGKEYTGTVDLICGGFPCQPFSSAGKRKGKEDDRYLWPEMLRVIREVQPTWVVGENVAGIVSMDSGAVLEQICSDLESEGFEVQSFIIPAISKGAPHRRDRIWIIAYSGSSNDRRTPRQLQKEDGQERISEREHMAEPSVTGQTHGQPSKNTECDGRTNTGYKESSKDGQFGNIKSGDGKRICDEQDITDTSKFYVEGCKPRQGEKQFRGGDSWYITNSDSLGQSRQGEYRRSGNTKENENRKVNRVEYDSQFKKHWYEVATRLCRVDDGLPAWVDRHRTPRLKALGNSIVPQVAYEIFKAIDQCK